MDLFTRHGFVVLPSYPSSYAVVFRPDDEPIHQARGIARLRVARSEPPFASQANLREPRTSLTLTVGRNLVYAQDVLSRSSLIIAT